MTMIEQVAKAIRAADMKHAQVDNWPEWDEVTSPHKAVYLERARAAIEAMREPTEEVGREAFNRVETDDWLDFLRGYRAMIDVALTE